MRNMGKNANVDYCGVRNLLEILKEYGFTEEELKKFSKRVAEQIGANIVYR